MDRANPRSFDKTCFAKHFAKQEGHFACFAVFQRVQRAVEGTGQRAPEGTDGHRGEKSCRGDRGQ